MLLSAAHAQNIKIAMVLPTTGSLTHIDKVKPKKVAVPHDKQSYGQGIASSVRDELKKAGLNIALFEGINTGDSDYSAVITKCAGSLGVHPEVESVNGVAVLRC